MSPVQLLEQTREAQYTESAYVYPIVEWTPEFLDLATAGNGEELGAGGPGSCSFEVPTLKLPLADDRWILTQRYARLTLEDVRARRVPKPTAEEIAQRREAIQMAQEIRPKLSIAPATTSAIIRCLRSGTEMTR